MSDLIEDWLSSIDASPGAVAVTVSPDGNDLVVSAPDFNHICGLFLSREHYLAKGTLVSMYAMGRHFWTGWIGSSIPLRMAELPHLE